MRKLAGFGILVGVIASALLSDSSTANAQIDGAVQYPPASVGEDAQPPPPARMVAQSVSPRRIELGVGGSSTLPARYPSRLRPYTETEKLPLFGAPQFGRSPTPPPTARGN
jgi:hypothetical protein